MAGEEAGFAGGRVAALLFCRAPTRSGILEQFPEINLEQQKVGIYGKVSKLDAVLNDGDRVEIYRPITCDPKTVPRKAKAEGAASEADAVKGKIA